VSGRWSRAMGPLSRQVPAINRPGIGMHALHQVFDLSLDLCVSYKSVHRCSPRVVAAGAVLVDGHRWYTADLDGSNSLGRGLSRLGALVSSFRADAG
jgi:hypothetical protein